MFCGQESIKNSIKDRMLLLLSLSIWDMAEPSYNIELQVNAEFADQQSSLQVSSF